MMNIKKRSDSNPLDVLRRGVPFIVMIMLPIAAGCDQIGKSSAQEQILKAKDLEDKGDLRASVIELKSALQQAPNNSEARLLLGEIYVKIRQGKDAEKELLQAKKLGVDEEIIKVPLGQALLEQEDYSRVLKDIQTSSRTSPKNASKILQIRGDAYFGLGQLEQGCDFYKQSAQTDAKYIPAYWGLARCAAAKNELDQAKSILEQALKQDPKNSVTWLWLGKLAQVRNDSNAAEASYSNALKIEPDNVDARLSLAFLHLASGNYSVAQKEIIDAQKISPGNLRSTYLQAFLNFRQSKYAAARDNLQVILKNFPDHMPSVLLLGMVDFALGNYEQAVQNLNKVLAQFPNSASARKTLASSWIRMGQPNRALETLKPLLTPENRDVNVWAIAGDAALKTRDAAQARGYIEKAATLDQRNPNIHAMLGISHLASGETGSALAELETASALDSSQDVADTLLILSHLRNQEYDETLKAIELLEKKNPNNPAVYNFRGAAYAGKKDLVNARKNFEHVLALNPAYVEADMNLAQLDLFEKKPQDAKKRYESILAKDKNNLQAMLALAEIARDEKERSAWLERAAKSNPSAFQPRRLLAQQYLNNQEPQKALVIANEARSANPSNPEGLDLLGTAQLAAGQTANALVTYAKLVQLEPNSPHAHYKLGLAQSVARNLDAAKSSLHQALKLKPDYLEAQVALISLELKTNTPAEALKIAQQVQKQNPKSPSGFVLEGDILIDQKRYKQAVKAYEEAFALGKSGAIAVRLHQAQFLAGSVKNADTLLLQWLKEQPKDSAARVYLAQSYMTRGQDKQAIEQYQTILQNAPGNLLALNNLALLYHRDRDPRALTLAEQAYKMRPDAAFITDTLGWILLDQGKTARAVELLEKAASLAPKNPEIGYHYAVALARVGDRLKARKQLEVVLALKQVFPQQEEARALLKQW